MIHEGKTRIITFAPEPIGSPRSDLQRQKAWRLFPVIAWIDRTVEPRASRRQSQHTNPLYESMNMSNQNVITKASTTQDGAIDQMTTKDATTRELTTNDVTTEDSIRMNNLTTEVVENDSAGARFVAFQKTAEEIRETLAADLGEATMTSTDFERIKIPAGGGPAWVVPDVTGEQMLKELSGIILMFRDVRTFWKVPLEQSGGNMPPDCYSMDAKSGIGSPGGSCQSCKFAQFGTDAKGEGQACKLYRQLLLLREENLLPEIVSLPASSIKAARLYLKRLAQKGLPCYRLITKIGLEKAQNGQWVYSRATFTASELLPPHLVKRAREYAKLLKSYLEAAPPLSITKDPPPEEGGEVV
jgi:hypothetical protein